MNAPAGPVRRLHHVAILLSDAAGYVTGATLDVTGGR